MALEKKYETYSKNLDNAIKDLQKSKNAQQRSDNRTRITRTILDNATEMTKYAIRRAEKIAS